MLHVGISYSFEKKKRLFIVDYIKPSPVYQVKCKLVIYCVHCATQLLIFRFTSLPNTLVECQRDNVTNKYKYKLFINAKFQYKTIS